jgi:hypothetical protein
MSFWKDLGRVGLGIATGGMSEVVRAGVKGIGGATQTDFRAYAPELDTAAFGRQNADVRGIAMQQAQQAPRSVPHVATPSQVSAQRVGPQQVTAGQIRDVTAPGVTQTMAQAPTAFTPATMQAAQGRAAGVQGTAIDTGQANQAHGFGLAARGQQDQAIGLLRSAAQGREPSAAQLQMQSGLGQLGRQSFALANSARGGAGAQMLAARQGMQQMAHAGMDLNQQQGILRAQEMAQARDAFAGATGMQRAGDLGLQQQGFAQGAAGAQMAQDRNFLQANLGQQMGLANVANQQQAGLLGAQFTQDARAQDYQGRLATELSNADRAHAAGIAGSQFGMQAQGMNQGIDAQRAFANQALDFQGQQFNAQTGLGAQQFNAQLGAQVGGMNQGAALQARALDDTQQRAMLGLGAQISDADRSALMEQERLRQMAEMQAQQINAQIALGNTQASTQVLGAGIGAFGSLFGSAVTGGGGK